MNSLFVSFLTIKAERTAFDFTSMFPLGFMDLVTVTPMCHGGKSEGNVDDTSEVNRSSPSVSGWNDTQEMEADVRSYRERLDCLSLGYVAHMKQQIEATANVDRENRDQVENGIRILRECKSRLSIVTRHISIMASEINNKRCTLQQDANNGNPMSKALIKAGITDVNADFDNIKKAMSDRVGTMNNKLGELTKTLYGSNDKDFTDLAISVAFLHDNLEQYNSFWSFASAIGDMLVLYERTQNNEIKRIIESELTKIPHNGKKIGPYGNEIKDFSQSLKRILGL
jgi:hypothetical protein